MGRRLSNNARKFSVRERQAIKLKNEAFFVFLWDELIKLST